MGGFSQAWQDTRPEADQSDIFFFDPETLHVYHSFVNGPVRQAFEDLAQPPGTFIGLSAAHTGIPPKFTEVRCLIRDNTGLRVYAKALDWAGPIEATWRMIG